MVSLAAPIRNGGVAPSTGGSLKRKHTIAEPGSDDLPSSQLKKRRVTFDPEVDVHVFSGMDDKSLELVEEEVRRALEKHAAGDNGPYDRIRELLTTPPTSSDAPLSGLLRKYLIALSNNVHLLDRKSSGMVHSVIENSWIARNDTYVHTYRHLLCSLLSIHHGYTRPVLHHLVEMFLELPPPALRQQDDPAIQRPQLQSRVHDCLRHVLRQNPMTSASLADILASTFPYPNETAKVHIQYMKNLLKVAEYCPEIKGAILTLVMDRLVKIDVQIQVDMEELEDDIEEQLVDAALNGVEEEEDMSDDESVMSDESIDEEERRTKEIKESVNKLDAIMDLLFSHYDQIFAGGDLADIDQTFETLLVQFSNIILPTYRSRHTQFLLFHFSQRSPDKLSPDLVERFAGCCSHLAFDHRRPPILRVSAAAYLASFIARGAHVSRQVVRDVFDLLCHHLELLRVAHEPSCKYPELSRYGTYYAIAQALIYTFCFRWRDLIVTRDDEPPSDQDVLDKLDFSWYNNIKNILQRNIYSKLNPLKICAPTIVNQFARVAHHLNFLYVYPLLETNKRIRLGRGLGGQAGYMSDISVRETALTMKKGEDNFLLDAYFPFDPYSLPRSKRWLENDYVSWKPLPGMTMPNDNDEEEDEDDEDEDEGDSESESDSEREQEVDDDDAELDDRSTEAST